MPVIVLSKTRYTGTVSIPSLNTETTVFDVGPLDDDYMVEGYIDVSQFASGDVVLVNEYVAVDGTNYRLFLSVEIRGPVPEPALRIHTRTLLKSMRYRLTVVQTAGTPRSVPYGFLVEVMGEV